jgi:hypothetical protein
VKQKRTPPDHYRTRKMRSPMHKIKPLNALILAKAKQGQSSPQFVIKTRVCLAISTDARNGLRRNYISTVNEGLAFQNAPVRIKTAPPISAMFNHPGINNLQQSTSRTWASTLHKPSRPRVLGKPRPAGRPKEESTEPTVPHQP